MLLYREEAQSSSSPARLRFDRLRLPVAPVAAHLAGHLIGQASPLQLHGPHVMVEGGQKAPAIFAILRLQVHTSDKH